MQKNAEESKRIQGAKKDQINPKIILQTGSLYFGSFSHDIPENGYFWSFSAILSRFYALKRLKTHEFERKPDQLPENAENMRFMSDLRNTDNKLGVKSS